MRNFDINEAKAGAAVCTRCGRRARIICFDARNDQPIVALIEDADNRYEIAYNYDIHGKWDEYKETARDLMMCEATDTLPKSWEEFCDSYPIEYGECYIGEGSTILKRFDGLRGAQFDKNLFRTKEQAEAMLAFIQLIRLRDVYRQGWEPDWDDATPKYCIRNFSGVIAEETTQAWGRPLSFQSEEILNTYWKNFSNLIETAKEFI